jgi:signal transduction histidine kinase
VRDHDGVAPLVGQLLTTVATATVVGGTTLSALTGDVPGALMSLAGLVAVGVGWVVLAHEPSSPVGPAIAWSSASVAAVLSIDALAASFDSASPLPLAGPARLVAVGSWPLNLAGILALLLVFPGGRPRAAIWRAVPWGYATATACVVAGEWGAREADGRVVGGPQDAPREVLSILGLLGVGACLLLAAACVAVRYRSGGQKRREQIRWLLLASCATIAALMLGWVAQGLGAPLTPAYAPFLLGIVVGVPAAVGLAMVRHDLFDVDRVLSASASWFLTLVSAAAVFGVVVLATSRLVGAGTNLGSTAAAFVTALVLLPLQRHVAADVGRVVDHDRFVAVAEVDAFAADVRTGRRPPEDVEGVLRHAVRNPELRLWLARPDGSWVDVSGRAADDTLGGPGDVAITTGGDTIAWIRLGRTSARARRRVADVARAGWVPIEVSRLRLVLREALADVEASRARLAEATATERKRLEQDLHDGVQQRLVATGMRLRSLQQRATTEAARGVGARAFRDLDDDLDAAVAELEMTVLELRRVAHGVRPGRLDDGLAAALDAVRVDSPVPLDLVVGDVGEVDETRALTAYLVVSEAVANALKHAQATRIRVGVHEAGERLVVEVSDDGVGGASPLGLTALRDRVHSLGGRLEVDSTAAQGTAIRAVL